MSKEESKRNKEVKKYKEKNASKIAYNENGKRIGKITRKHVNVRRANEVFSSYLSEPLIKKDEDIADALLLGYAYHLRKAKIELPEVNPSSLSGSIEDLRNTGRL